MYVGYISVLHQFVYRHFVDFLRHTYASSNQCNQIWAIFLQTHLVTLAAIIISSIPTV
jgi:hypothetical protein